MLSRVITILLIVVVFALGGLAGWYFFAPKKTSVEESQVLLERVRSVMKLVTVEGQYSEIYSHSDYQGAFTFFWDKKMLIRVSATVAAGYDLEQMRMEADPEKKVLYMSGLPEPKVLSIDHKIDYYDISEGVFTSFSPQDYTRINDRAKEIIREKAQIQLLPAARQQAGTTLDMIRTMLEGAGWRLEVSSLPAMKR